MGGRRAHTKNRTAGPTPTDRALFLSTDSHAKVSNLQSRHTRGMRMPAGPAAEEQQLILRAREGSHDAFRCLVERHMKNAYNVAYNFVNDHHAAEEVAQEAFVRVYQSLDSFRGDAEFSTWLYRIVTNLSLNRLKQIRRRREREASSPAEEYVASPEDTGAMPGTEMSEHIERALHELPTMQRAVVILRHVDGLSTKQVSRILRCSEGTVKTHLFRGLEKLKKKLDYLQKDR
jgi:RNA polymerase sigma-70 factor, ECF subfamily